MSTTDKGPFYVTGGEYADSSFTKLVAGARLETYGPFDDYETARKEWRGRTMATIDNAMIRYQIVPGGPAARAA